MKEDKTFDLLTQMIDKAFSNYYKKEKKMETVAAPVEQPTTFYESIEDYTTVTGKRFRMTKEQKQRGLTRDEAFTETFGDYDR